LDFFPTFASAGSAEASPSQFGYLSAAAPRSDHDVFGKDPPDSDRVAPSRRARFREYIARYYGRPRPACASRWVSGKFQSRDRAGILPIGVAEGEAQRGYFGVRDVGGVAAICGSLKWSQVSGSSMILSSSSLTIVPHRVSVDSDARDQVVGRFEIASYVSVNGWPGVPVPVRPRLRLSLF
jgi:hypothetical protein